MPVVNPLNWSRLTPLNFPKWVAENGDRMKPPVTNSMLYDNGNFMVMAVGGPNTRNDYHVNETEEWFYQVKGHLVLKVVDGDEFKDVRIEEGEMLLLPPHIPHSPQRYPDTVGIVLEMVRPEGSLDRLRWYCQSGKHEKPHVVREVSFHAVDLAVQLKPHITEWMSNDDLRVCQECGFKQPPAYTLDSK